MIRCTPLLLLSVLASCGRGVSLDPGSSPAGTGGAGGANASATGGAAGSATGGAAGSATGAADGSATGAADGSVALTGCKGWGPPTAVNIDGTFCIDATNVTNSQYMAFLSTAPPTTLGQPDFCTWNTSFTPTGTSSGASEADYPVVNVNFCDAWAYCAWAGKRLCASLPGLTAAFDDDFVDTEYYYACSGGARQLGYPYGSTYDSSKCNTSSGSFVAAPVQSLAGCVSAAYPGLYDLGGNYAFWENICNGTTGSLDGCRESPPSAFGAAVDYECNGQNYDVRDATISTVTIRCCSDAVAP